VSRGCERLSSAARPGAQPRSRRPRRLCLRLGRRGQARRRARACVWAHATCDPPGGSNADLTFEKLIDRGFFICGDPDTVYDGIKNVYDEVGGFGTLLLIYGKDWGTLEQRCRSMERFMAEVAPRLAALDPDKPRVASAAE
jgi:alkanesulfonate monooxygenase SsuD/methylene tetrahydromethanopterin reductase-like flavin-dependent oxidoreductase (luciferase family)